jgi:hypothetical protein
MLSARNKPSLSPSCGLPASEPTSYCNGARKCVHSFSASPFNAYQGLRVVRRSAYLFSQFPFFTVLYVSSNVNPLQYLRNILSKHMSYLDYHVGIRNWKLRADMRRREDGRLTLVLIRGCLQVILTISIAEATMSFYLYSNHWVDSTISPSEILIVLSVCQFFNLP